jgi:hypothetical protein
MRRFGCLVRRGVVVLVTNVRCVCMLRGLGEGTGGMYAYVPVRVHTVCEGVSVCIYDDACFSCVSVCENLCVLVDQLLHGHVCMYSRVKT